MDESHQSDQVPESPLIAAEAIPDNTVSRTGEGVPTLILPSLLLTFFCCFPFGLAALLSGLKVKSCLADGDFDAALAASERARYQLKLGFALGIVAAILVMIFQLLLGAA